MVTGDASMMSPTVTPSRRSVTRAPTAAPRAELAMSQPRTIHQIPPKADSTPDMSE
jgi:hypothetical protein